MILSQKNFFILLLGLLSFTACEIKEEDKPPNVLWLVTEDLSPFFLNAYGDPRAPTPNLDRLAKEGVVYTHNFSVAGVCSPSRATLATGLYPNSFGAHNMRTLKQQAIAKAAGLVDYQVVPPPEVKMVSEIMRENGYYTTNNSKEDYQFFKSELAWDESSGYAHWRNRPNKEMPFFSVFNANVTHESNMWSTQYKREGHDVFPPPRTAESQWEKLGYKNYQAYKNDTIPLQVPEDLAVEVPPYLPQNEIGENAMRKLYSNIVRMDRFMGILLQQLEEDGLLEETIIVWYSDHGGPLPRQKRLLYDSGLRVPLIIRYPNKQRAGERDDRLISFVDYPPTLFSMVGIQPPSYMEGQAFEGKYKVGTPRSYIHGQADRFDERVDLIRAVRNKRFKYLKNFYPEKPYYLPIVYRENMEVMQELLRMRDAGELDENQALWFRTSKPAEELFDTETDPHELKNLADDPAYTKVLKDLRTECERWMKAIDDKGFINEIELIQKFYPNGKPQWSEVPNLTFEGGKITVNASQPGVRIGYKYSNEKAPHKGWNIYSESIEEKPDDTLEIITHRLGFKYGITKVVNGKKLETHYPLNKHELNP